MFLDSWFGKCFVPPGLAAAAGYRHACAVRADSQLVCFAQNDSGQCDVPPGLGKVVAVAAGVYQCFPTVVGMPLLVPLRFSLLCTC